MRKCLAPNNASAISTELITVINESCRYADIWLSPALVVSGLEAGALDVTFLDDTDPLAAELARVALRFDLPEPAQPKIRNVEAPGSDPEKPPKLR